MGGKLHPLIAQNGCQAGSKYIFEPRQIENSSLSLHSEGIKSEWSDSLNVPRQNVAPQTRIVSSL